VLSPEAQRLPLEELGQIRVAAAQLLTILRLVADHLKITAGASSLAIEFTLLDKVRAVQIAMVELATGCVRHATAADI
jgi:hypothetical protein